MTTQLVWFRNDLRLVDNPAFYQAANLGPMIAVYIDDFPRPDGEHGAWWRRQSLFKLHQSLKKKGGGLIYVKGDAEKELLQIVDDYKVIGVHWNRLYEKPAIERDAKIKETLKNKGIEVHSYNGSLLFEPWTVQTKQGEFFKVFSPFWKQCLAMEERVGPALEEPKKVDFAKHKLKEIPADFDSDCPTPHRVGDPGEKAAWQKLEDFVEKRLSDYASGRDIPAKKVTSELSAYLRFGEISPRQIWHFVQEKSIGKPMHKFLSEIGWREFSYNLLYHFPTLGSENYQSKFNNFPWRPKSAYKSDLEKWQNGETGYPLVDAGMRELNQSGYMHNRIRMVVGSFLTKNLLIPWQEGEAYFWEKLYDADPANNTASWQWIAGSGADAAPYFRVFNPVLQSKKFDPAGAYIKTWVEELKDVDPEFVHDPWEKEDSLKAKFNFVLGKDYPKPIVDLKATRDRALSAYDDIKEKSD
ncbi:MAG: deoxyribodipyrimidine photolyase [Rickettsiales bacterium]|nr:deoxyribodipyrimidine photolyase [Rickettsiales bacterium]|tara:strand:+ start:9566 stop:10972 length:1407 start_codon:yes stop_codon:yes gene_type:complete